MDYDAVHGTDGNIQKVTVMLWGEGIDSDKKAARLEAMKNNPISSKHIAGGYDLVCEGVHFVAHDLGDICVIEPNGGERIVGEFEKGGLIKKVKELASASTSPRSLKWWPRIFLL